MTRNPPLSWWAKREAFFFNHGATVAFCSLILALNIAMAVWGAWEFTAPHWTIESRVLRLTLPIARAGGRVVTFNVSLLLLSACKSLWTLLRRSPLHLGFPMDDIMPKYHRVFAWTVIFMGCVVHTLPQIVNYATQELKVSRFVVWTWGDGMATGQLMATGVALFLVFVMFFVTTLERVRRTGIGFRVFWLAHLLGLSLGFPLLVIHGTMRGKPILLYFCGIPLVLYGSDSIIRRCCRKTCDAAVWNCQPHDGDKVVELVLHCPGFEYQPGQYAEIKIPELSNFEWHPFTIASAPNDEGKVSFFIKAVGRWTNALYENASIDLSVSIRGPFGAPAQNYLDYQHICIIGSGIGVTPLLSVWQYLLSKASNALDGKSDLSKRHCKPEQARNRYTRAEEVRLLESSNLNAVDIVALEKRTLRTLSGKVAYFASALETMTVNICLFVFSLFMEVAIFSIWLFEFNKEAAAIQIGVSAIAMAIFGSKIVLSTGAYGFRYFRSLVFSLEATILILDAGAYSSSLTTFHSPSRPEAISYFAFFGGFLLFHAIRIFHIFYATARPPRQQVQLGKNDGSKILSVTGVWVARHAEQMSFAAPLLMRSRTASNNFDLHLYATRDDKATINEPWTSGRPDWEALFEDLIEKAHASNPEEGVTVGVFFCGSPAIARTLQRTALEVTCAHQERVRRDTRMAGRSRILVHKENF